MSIEREVAAWLRGKASELRKRAHISPSQRNEADFNHLVHLADLEGEANRYDAFAVDLETGAWRSQ